MAGRGLRPDKDKSDCILLDHSGCIERHGFVDDDMSWSLNDKEKAWKKPPKKKEKHPLTCDMCSRVFTGKRCPQCGYEIPDYGKKIDAIEARLEQQGRSKKQKATGEEKRLFYGMLEHHRRIKGFQQGWASHKYKEKFGTWPNHYRDQGPIEPDAAFNRYLRHLNIKWAKSKEKATPKHSDEVGYRKNPNYDNWGGMLSDG